MWMMRHPKQVTDSNNNFEIYLLYSDQIFGVKITRPTIVEIDPNFRKPFLGGFRDRRNGMEYHHASTQTPPPPKSVEQIRVSQFKL